MVLLTVKGTTFPDEFTVECKVDDSLDTIALDIPAPPPPPSLEEATEMEKNNIPMKPPAQIAAEYHRAKNDEARLQAVQGQGLAPLLAHLLNQRHYLRLMLLSAGELVEEVIQQRGLFSVPKPGKSAGEEGDRTSRRCCAFTPEGVRRRSKERLTELRKLVDETYALLKDKKHVITIDKRDEVDALCHSIRQEIIYLFPEWCEPAVSTTEVLPSTTLTESGALVEDISEGAEAATVRAVPPPLTPEQLEAVISNLYALHENPDLDEDERLVVYHCRLILDHLWREEERELAGEVGIWFSSKLMTGTLQRYGNDKSKLTVRLGKRSGPAPSGEPRISYEDQRALFQRIREKRETFKHLEESELRDRVVQQSRGRVNLGAGGTVVAQGAAVGIGLDESAIKMRGRKIVPATA